MRCGQYEGMSEIFFINLMQGGLMILYMERTIEKTKGGFEGGEG